SETLTILPDEMLTIYVSGQTTLGAFYKFSSHKQDMWGAKLVYLKTVALFRKIYYCLLSRILS
ncbi:MAG: hypothetical protein LBJ77_03130, partial [Holosporales bacterium]|nr:hypothetical protein [Holosporales bacterium]